jgi:glutamyl/glutaminyl-tRNA synthetase
VEDFIQKGYLKEAIINFVALLGWNPGEGSTEEFFTLDELIKKFELSHVHKAGAIFDLKKLDWLNSQYIKKLPLDELYELALEFLKEKDFYNSWDKQHATWDSEEKENYLKKVLFIEKERLNNLSEVGENNKFFFQDLEYEKDLLNWKNMSPDDLKNSLKKSAEILENIAVENWTKENLEKVLLEAAGEKRGELLWPLRAALTGEKKSPSPFEVAWVLGKEKSLKRLVNALNLI